MGSHVQPFVVVLSLVTCLKFVDGIPEDKEMMLFLLAFCCEFDNCTEPTMATQMLSFMVRGNTNTICVLDKNVQVEYQLHVLQLFHCYRSVHITAVPLCSHPDSWHNRAWVVSHRMGGNPAVGRPWILRYLHFLWWCLNKSQISQTAWLAWPKEWSHL